MIGRACILCDGTGITSYDTSRPLGERRADDDHNCGPYECVECKGTGLYLMKHPAEAAMWKRRNQGQGVGDG